jgi:L-seryl-tRNA(Ser) seleniumtransferase
VDIVTFSGDKLLGGPQAGLILGRAELVRTLKENQLLRALRVDKFTLAALEATLQAYVQEEAEQALPVLRMLTVPPARLQQQAMDLQKLLAGRLAAGCAVAVRKGSSTVGGGALPLDELPTTLVELRPACLSAAGLAERLRRGDPPVLVHIQDECVLLDPRTIRIDERELLVDAVAAALSGGEDGD